MKKNIYNKTPFLKKICFLFCLFFIPAISFCQLITSVNVVVRPPYSSNYTTYENLANHAIITLVGGPEDVSVILYGSLASDQTDFFIHTREGYNGGSFILHAHETKVIINDVPKMLFLSRNNVDHGNISDELWQQILKNGQLPEGQYQLCVQVHQITVDGQVDPGEIASACANFSLTQAQPPVITTPQDGQELNLNLPNTVFSWTPPIGNTLGAAIVYDLYVVKVPQGQDPNDAMNAAVNYKANNPLIKTNLTGNQYVTQPYDLKLDSNQLYAVQVIARDMNRQVSFKNNGKSEVVTFTKGKVNVPGIIITGPIEIKKPKPPKPTFGGYDVSNVDPVPYSQLKGKLYYRFKDALPSANKNKTIDQPKPEIKGNAVLMGDDKLSYNIDNIPIGDAEPLAGRKISLVVTYLFTGTRNSNIKGNKNANEEPLNKESSDLSPGNAADADKVLATTVTGPDGSFQFNFVNIEKDLGLLNKDYQYASSGGEFYNNVKGKLYKVLRLRVEDKYYCSPDVNIKIDPWKGVDLGTVVSYVKSYSLKVKVTTTNATFWDMAQGQGSPLPAITTMLTRKNIFSSIPANEGENTGGGRKMTTTTRQLATHESGKDGFVTFRHLVQHDPDNKTDRYYIKCVPDEKKGNFIFKEKEETYYPLYNEERNNFPFNSTGEYMPPPVEGGFNIAVTYGQDITWNHELEIKTYIDNIALYPSRPRIAGKVQDATNPEAKAISDVKVVMINSYKYSLDPSKLFKTVKTNIEGRYEFNNLDMEIGEFKPGLVTTVEGPTRTIITKPGGYKAGTLPAKPPYPPLKWGQQLLNQDFFLTPDGMLSGYVVDENGNSVHADIDVDGFSKTTTKFVFTYDKKPTRAPANPSSGNLTLIAPTGSKESFSMIAPSGKRKITITPTDKAYAPNDTTLIVPKSDSKSSPVKFVVFRSQKRLRFKIAETPSGYKPHQLQLPGSTAKAIAGAKVKLDIPGKPMTQTSDKDGYVSFIFDNSASDFDFIITPPDNADYEEGHYKISGTKNTLQTVTYGNAYLKKAATITGTITLGPDKKTLAGAEVYIDMGAGKKLSITTGTDGKYVLKGVPTSPVEKTVWAGKSGTVPNIISQSKNITISNNNTLDFNLMNDNELLIENIYGFDTDIQSKTKQPDGTWLVSGSLIHLPANDNFSLQDDKQSIPFHDLKIKKSGETKNGIPVGVPAESTMATDLANIKLLLQKSFGIIQHPASGDQLQLKAENQKGKLMGKMAIQKSSFQFTQEYVKFNDDPNDAMLLTEKAGSFNTDLPSIEASTSAKKKFGLANLKGQKLNFILLGFNADADAAQSWIQDNSISLQTIIHINSLPGMSPSTIDVNAGNLVIHPDKLEPLKGDQPIKFKLEKWDFIGSNWQLIQSSSSITMATGTIKTGSIDVPVSNISIEPNHLGIGNFDVNNLTLAGIIPVHVITTTPAFGYNKSIGNDQKAHYELRLIGENGNPGVLIKELPGMKAGDEMKFQNFSLISNGEQMVNPGNQGNSIMFYNIMKVKPLAFTSGQDYVNMDCGIDLSIPQLQETSGVIQFSKEAGKLKLLLYPLNVSLKGPGGVDFSANVQFNDHPQNLTEGKFTALGTIHDKEGISLKGILNKTTQAAWIQVDPENQKLPLGGGNTSLADIKGKMEADISAGIWKNFIFSGRMEGFKGMQGDTRKTFTVTGSINANKEKVEVKNIPSGFGNIGLTYDIANSRFTGNLQLDKQIGPLSMSGTAALLVDPGGWYFLAGGKLITPGLGEMSAGLLIGDYNSMPGNVTTQLMQYAYDKHVPPSFQHGISGFFFTGMKTLPVINIPNYSMNLGIISASFGAEAGLDGRLWMGFSNAGNEYGIGAMVFAHAYLKGASITCTKFGADARAELGIKGMYATSTGAFSLNGCGSFTISGSIEQCFPTPCWDGICCKYCAGISKSAGIKIDLLLDSKGNTDMSFGFGNCSGQSTMSGNW
ncbi:MAG TPA: carboxypeptidase-like regulatory domain-containing protein [Ferruginibacter sp.]|nr:carboxypeptidase-like regulatory domain-containing protein [Ferruginibacter sp.]